jgi:hypothetical protein
MVLTTGVKETISEMIKVQQVLRKTSPLNKMNADDRRQVLAAIDEAEETLKKMRKEVKGT